MDPITILSVLSAILGTAAVIFVAYLAISEVRTYLRKTRTERSNKEAAFIIKKQMENGNVRVIAGFLDDEDVTESQTWEAESVDSKIRNLDDDEPYIVT